MKNKKNGIICRLKSLISNEINTEIAIKFAALCHIKQVFFGIKALLIRFSCLINISSLKRNVVLYNSYLDIKDEIKFRIAFEHSSASSINPI